MHTRKAITEAIRKLGVQTGDLLMVHASLKAIGPVEGGAETVVGPITLRGDSEWRSVG
ncbi:aminoglycoside acetyltransferase [Klebsiella pneumoniae]|nr:aminoglycoside acetyltransferase [Klebsiella pneumoniae]